MVQDLPRSRKIGCFASLAKITTFIDSYNLLPISLTLGLVLLRLSADRHGTKSFTKTFKERFKVMKQFKREGNEFRY